jgi:beta-glucosidase
MFDWVGTYSTIKAIKAGLDLEMPGPTKFRGQSLLDAAQEGKATEATTNSSPRSVLELAGKSGRFEKPDDRNEVYIDSPESDEFITAAAAEATVLLKTTEVYFLSSKTPRLWSSDSMLQFQLLEVGEVPKSTPPHRYHHLPG